MEKMGLVWSKMWQRTQSSTTQQLERGVSLMFLHQSFLDASPTLASPLSGVTLSQFR